MAPLGRAALLLAFGLVLYALVAGSYAAWKRRRRLALSAQNALLAAFPVTLVAAIVLLVLTGYAGLAVWLNRRSRDLVAWTVPVFGLVASFFAFMLCFVSSPFSLQPLR